MLEPLCPNVIPTCFRHVLTLFDVFKRPNTYAKMAKMHIIYIYIHTFHVKFNEGWCGVKIHGGDRG